MAKVRRHAGRTQKIMTVKIQHDQISAEGVDPLDSSEPLNCSGSAFVRAPERFSFPRQLTDDVNRRHVMLG